VKAASPLGKETLRNAWIVGRSTPRVDNSLPCALLQQSTARGTPAQSSVRPQIRLDSNERNFEELIT
jgi:hypothetical protein